MAWDVNAATQYGLSKGYLKPGETATGGLLEARARAAGQGAYDELKATQNTMSQPGYTNTSTVGMPLSIEPRNEWEKTALEGLANPGLLGGGAMGDAQAKLRELLANPTSSASSFTSPLASTYLTKAGDAVASGLQGYVQSDVDKYMNPLQDSVHANIDDSAARAKAALMKNLGQRGGAAFGSTVTSDRLAQQEKGVRQEHQDVDYKGFQDAVGNMQKERDRSIQGGQVYGGLGGTAQDVFSNALSNASGGIKGLFGMGQEQTAQGYQNLKERLAAGKDVRSYNQNIADIIQNDMTLGDEWPRTKLSNTLSLLKGFEGTTPGSFDPSMLSQIGSAVGVGSNIGDMLKKYFPQTFGGFTPSPGVSYSGVQGGSLPWLTY